MITINKIGNTVSVPQLEIYCKSTDVKPIREYQGKPIPNGSILIEIDTGDSYFYDEETHTWTPT